MLEILTKYNKRSIIVSIYKKDGRVERFYKVPVYNAFSHNDRRYVVTNKALSFEGQKPHYIYKEETALPIKVRDIVTMQGQQIIPIESLSASARDLEIHKRDTTVSQMFDVVSRKYDPFLMAVLGMLVMVAIVGAGIYLSMQGFNDLNSRITELNIILEAMVEEGIILD